MDWIFDNLPIVLFIAISLASFIKSRMEARKTQEQADRMPPVEEQPEDWFGPEDDWEHQTQDSRQSSLPPPIPNPPAMAPVLVKVKPVIPPRYSHDDQASVFIPVVDAELSRQQELRERLQQLREKRAVTTGGAAATKKRLSGVTSSSSTHDSMTLLRPSLRQRSYLRRALVTKEILGPPLSLNPANRT